MKRNPVIAGAVFALASILAITSCKKEEIATASTPQVKLEVVSEGLTSVSFSISATNASEVAYVRQDNLSSLPSAKAILTAGTKVSADEAQEIEITDCTPGETYYVAAAAVSESGEYSEVVTLSMTAAGTDCSFEVSIGTLTDKAITYTVTPSVETLPYVVSILSGETYENASDDEVFAAIGESMASSAEEAGQSLSDYISTISRKGVFDGSVSGLTKLTKYVIVVVGIDTDGTQTTPMYRNTITTTDEKPQMKFSLSVTDITAYSAHISVNPTPENSNYWFVTELASKYPDVNVETTPGEAVLASVEDANKVADEYIKNETLLNSVSGYMGSYDLPGFSLVSDTKYYLIAFAWEPGLGRQSDCAMIAFETEHGVVPEEFDATINIASITATMVKAEVTPTEESNGILWTAVAIPTAEYSVDAAQAAVQEMIDAQYKLQIEHNPAYTKADAASSICFQGQELYTEVPGLEPETAYTLAIVPVANDGTAVKHAVTAEFTTIAEPTAVADCTIEKFGYYSTAEANEKGLFPTIYPVNQTKYVIAYTITKGENVTKCEYQVVGGDYTTRTDEYAVDDYIYSWGVKEIPMEDFDADGTNHLVLFGADYDTQYYDYTLVVYTYDKEGNRSASKREYIKVISTELDPVEELVELMNSDPVQ